MPLTIDTSEGEFTLILRDKKKPTEATVYKLDDGKGEPLQLMVALKAWIGNRGRG